jgi:hypothetical protein
MQVEGRIGVLQSVRRNRELGLVLCGVVAVVGHVSDARAREMGLPSPDAAPPRASGDPPPHDWGIGGTFGAFTSIAGMRGGGVQGGLSVRYRSGYLVVGTLFEGGSAPLGLDSFTFAAGIGPGTRMGPLRAEMLGMFGGHFYNGGPSHLNENTPFVGARGVLSYLFGKSSGHFELGAFAECDMDLLSAQIDDISTHDGPIGMSRLTFGVEIGGTSDVL